MDEGRSPKWVGFCKRFLGGVCLWGLRCRVVVLGRGESGGELLDGRGIFGEVGFRVGFWGLDFAVSV